MKSLDFKQILAKIKSQRGVFTNLLSKRVDSVLVIEISDKLVIFSVDIKNEPKINAFKSVPLSKDKKDETIITAIGDFIKENNIGHKHAIFNPLLESAVIKRITIPAVPDSELAEAIKWQIKNDISFDLSKAIVEYSIIKKTTKEDGSRLLDIICLAAKEDEIKRQVLLLRQLGLSCLSVGISPFGYGKIIEKFLMPKVDEPMAILNIDDNKCYLSIYKNNKLEFYRELPVSIGKLKESLKGVLGSDKGKVELSSAEVDEILAGIGIPLGDSLYKQKVSSIQILSLLRPILERLIVEIKRSLSYYNSEYAAGAVKKILVAGPALKIPNLDKFLAKELSLGVEALSLKDKLAVSSGINQQDLSECYASLGLIFDYEKEVNLLPYEFRTEQIENVEKVSLRWVVFIAILLLAMSFLFTKVRIGILQRSVNNAKVHLGTLTEVRQLTDNLNELNNFVKDVKKTEVPVGVILKKLSNLATKELFFSQLSINCDSKTGLIKGFVKTLSRNPDAVLTEFISAMKNSGYFKEVKIANVSKEDKQGSDIATFNINFQIN